MRILHVTKKYPNAIGGDATCVFNLEKAQGARGYTVFILTANCHDVIIKDNVYIFGLKDTAYNWDSITIKRVLSLALFCIQSLVIIKKVKPDIIHSHSADLGFLIALWAKFLHIPVLNTCHTINYPYPFITPLKRYPELIALKFGFFSKIITFDPKSIPFFHTFGIRHYEYMNMAGVDIDEFEAIKVNICPLSEHKITKFIFVGRLDALKGLEYLINAAAELKKNTEHFEVLIIGDGPYKDELKKKTNILGVETHIKFFEAITSRQRLIELYCGADIFVLPSLVETFSLVVLEAWAAGLAVISTRVGIVSRVGREKENVLTIPKKDSWELYRAMFTLMKDVELRRKIAYNGKKLVRNNFTWNMVVENLEHIYAQYRNRVSEVKK